MLGLSALLVQPRLGLSVPFSARNRRRICLEQVERIPLQSDGSQRLQYRKWIDAVMRDLPERDKDKALRVLHRHLAHSTGLVFSTGETKKAWDVLPKIKAANNYLMMHGASPIEVTSSNRFSAPEKLLTEIGRSGLVALVDENQDELEVYKKLRSQQKGKNGGGIWNLINRTENTFNGVRHRTDQWKAMRKDPTQALGRFIGQVSECLHTKPEEVLEALPRINTALSRFKANKADFISPVTEDQMRLEHEVIPGQLWPHVFLAKPLSEAWNKRVSSDRGTKEQMTAVILANLLCENMPKSHRRNIIPIPDKAWTHQYYQYVTPVKYRWALKGK